MQYQVPQFIEVEDKIFGPLTFKQFLYVAGGGAIGFLMYALLPTFLALIIGTPIVVFFLGAAFYKVNGQPFIFFVENFFKYTLSSKLYIWKKAEKKPKVGKRKEATPTEVPMPKLSQSKLKELSWGLDIHENLGGENKM